MQAACNARMCADLEQVRVRSQAARQPHSVQWPPTSFPTSNACQQLGLEKVQSIRLTSVRPCGGRPQSAASRLLPSWPLLAAPQLLLLLLLHCRFK